MSTSSRTLQFRDHAAARVVILGSLVVGLEWARVLGERSAALLLPSMVLGGAALCLLAFFKRPEELGLSTSNLGFKIVGGVALAAVLLLPAAVRSAPVPYLSPQLGLAAIAISLGEEIAFRGVLYAALEALGGPAVAIGGSTALFTLAHVLSHPPAFLVPVTAAGLLLALWRWACRDLIAPMIGHSLADLAL